MEIISPVHGKIIYEENDIIEFTKPIPGFKEYSKYIVKDIEGSEPFKLLQSIENAELAFIVISPFEVEEKYEINIDTDTINKLNIVSPKDVMLYSTVTLNSKVENITTNLKAPIIININNKTGAQCIVDNEKYKIKHPLIKR